MKKIMNKDKKQHLLSIRLSDDYHKKIKMASAKSGVSMQQIIADLIMNFVDHK